MTDLKRAGTALLAVVLASGAVASLMAQIPGMPLFTNPRYGTGIRIHADIGQPTDAGTSLGDLTVIQAGASFAIGPVGVGVNAGMLKNQAEALNLCDTNSGNNCDLNTRLTGSALAQIRVAGGGRSKLSLSIFGGASTAFGAYDLAVATTGGVPVVLPVALEDSLKVKALTIPVGVAVGLRIPLGVASLNLWGAPRMNLTRYSDCPATQTSRWCADNSSKFRWAAGADLPIFRIISVRAAYDSGEDLVTGKTASVWGVGVSFGIGGMR
jgi:hypothetical protein